MNKGKVGLLGLALVVAVSAAAHEGQFHVSKSQLDELKALSSRLQDLSRHVVEEFDDPEVIPDAENRRHFREDVGHVVNAAAQQLQLFEKISGTAVPATPKDVTIPGHYVVGIHSTTKDISQASSAHSTECNLWAALFRDLSGADSYFTCGSQENVSPYASVGYYQYASKGSLSVKVPADARVQEVSGQSVTSSSAVTKEIGEAYKTWRDACHSALRAAKNNSGARFVGGSCGIPSNVSPYASVGYYLFSSTIKLHLKD